MKKGAELRKIVTIVRLYEIEDLIPEEEIDRFMEIYMPAPDCFIEFSYTSPEYDAELPELERVLRDILEIPASEIILIEVSY